MSRIDLKLYEGDKRILSTSKRVRLRILTIVDEQSKWTHGTVRLWYNVEEDFWNEGTFTTITGLRQLLTEFNEVGIFDTAKGLKQVTLN